MAKNLPNFGKNRAIGRRPEMLGGNGPFYLAISIQNGASPEMSDSP